MSAADFWWNAHQAIEINELKEENKQLRKEIDRLTLSLNGWVKYFNNKIEHLEKKDNL